MTIVAIIPARGGSKGLPRKNVRLLGGKPLVAYSIEAARATPGVDQVYVSTDDREIGGIAEAYGAQVIRRPAEISGDTASSESALLHALDAHRAAAGADPELVVFLQATSPLRAPDDIARALATLRAENADSLFSATPGVGFAWRTAPGQVAPVNYDPAHRPRRQDLKEWIIYENGSIYIFKPSVLRAFNSRLGGRIAVHLMDRRNSFEIDELDDLVLMEELLALRRLAAPDASPDLSAVKLLVLDFDGVLTDNRVLVDEAGREAVWCHRGDGWGIARLKEAGLPLVVVSTETNPVVAARCRKLAIPCVQGSNDKRAVVQQLAAQHGLGPEAVAYVGNDVNDLECLAWVGAAIAVSDATPPALAAARWVTQAKGGAGAVREVAEWYLRSNAERAHGIS